MASFGTFWENYPIVGWAYDDEEALVIDVPKAEIDSDYIDYQRIFDRRVAPIFSGSSFSIDFGGASDKDRLIAIDRPLGVFNFSLASKTLYKKVEYYSDELAREQPDKFIASEKPSGIVPPNLVSKAVINGISNYFYKDKDIGKEYICVQQQEGTQGLALGLKNAALKFGSRTKKVYNTYAKKGGKVKYVEIYSLFYYAAISGETQFAIRHFPALMVANYLESIGIKTRVYMTRFVKLDEVRIKQKFKRGGRNPMYDMLSPAQQGRKVPALYIQPLPAKDYGEDLNIVKMLQFPKADAELYKTIANNGIKNEATTNDVFGDPLWSQEKYLEGFERYRQKYLQYTRTGIWRAKEVTAEGMIFYHDESLQSELNSFMGQLTNITNVNEVDSLQQPNVNEFFNWWMITCANTIKHKIDLLNTDNRVLTIRDIDSDLNEQRLNLRMIIDKTTNQDLKNLFERTSREISNTLKVNDVYSYIDYLVQELTSYASGSYFPTPQESIDQRNEFAENVLKDLIYI